jgi:hypothetical protein
MNDKLLIVDYLQNKLKAARADVELFSLLLDEVMKLEDKADKLVVNNSFLKIVGREDT